MMNRSDFRFLERLRVRWSEVDLQKIVFNGHYLMYFDTAVAGYWRALALPYHSTMAMLQGDLYVRKASVEYLGSARYDDLCDIGMRCSRIGNSSMQFEGAVFRGESLLVQGELVYVFADPATQTSRPVPPDLRRVVEGFENGGAVLEMRTGTWDELGREAKSLRSAVFVEEQKIPADLEYDAADANAVHAVAFNRFGMALATGRLIEHDVGVMKIGRMAVHGALRGAGIGRQVLEELIAAARTRGARQVLLHARASAVGFYQRAGFHEKDAPFDEAGIRHQAMVRQT
jgi:YbgC/YbaW family acyl-CoA thioester hydrolase